MMVNMGEIAKDSEGLYESETILKTFKNGEMVVYNVPYKKESRENDLSLGYEEEAFLPYHVLYQLSHIMKYMKTNEIKEIDYQRYLTEKANFNTKYEQSQKIKKESNVGKKEKTEKEKKEIIKYVMKDWLEQYFVTKLRARPIESYDNKLDSRGEEAQQWLNYFYDKLSQLPDMHREIIERKYLQKDYDGRYPIDEIVYSDMHIARGSYYIRKKEAIYWLGLGLMESGV